MPETIFDVAHREKEIRYSSRTRLNTDQFRQTQTMRRAARRLVQKLPPELRDDPDAVSLDYWSCNAAITIAHLINRRRPFDTDSKDYEFSRLSMEERWTAGRDDVRHGLQRKDWLERRKPEAGVAIFDQIGRASCRERGCQS